MQLSDKRKKVQGQSQWLGVMLCPLFGMEFSKWALSAAFPCADGGAPAALEGIPPNFLLTPLLRAPGLRKGRDPVPAPAHCILP